MGNASVGIVMGSRSDLERMQPAADFLEEMKVAYEMTIASAHRAPHLAHEFALHAQARGLKVIIAGAGGAAHLPGVVAAYSHLPVIGVPLRSQISLDGWDSVLSILQMPPGIPVATVTLDGARNAGILAVQILALSDEALAERFTAFRQGLRRKTEDDAAALAASRG